jgi:hypothetical protein
MAVRSVNQWADQKVGLMVAQTAFPRVVRRAVQTVGRMVVLRVDR